jgi:amino-acid N-acetyltransferase
VEATFTQGRAEGVQTLYLLTTTAPEFFARLGLEEAARITAPLAIQKSWEFELGCPSSAQLMRRAI